jgi:hypothetical protein
MAKAEENFKKWLVLPGKNKSDKERSEDLQALFSRTNKGKSSSSNPPAEKTKAQIEQENYAAKQKSATEKRKATMQAKKEAAAKVQAVALEQASAEGLAVLARTTSTAAAAAAAAETPRAVHNLQVYLQHILLLIINHTTEINFIRATIAPVLVVGRATMLYFNTLRKIVLAIVFADCL